MINYWTFDNQPNDIIGGANLFSGVNTSFVSDRSGNDYSAVYLNKGFYNVPSGVYFSGNHTVSVWAKAIEFSSYARIIDFGNGLGPDSVILSISIGNSGKPFSQVSILTGFESNRL